MDPEITRLLTSLAEVATRNTASAVTTKIVTLKKKKNDSETISYLEDTVNELLDGRQQLIGIGQALQQELTSRTISQEDVEYITGTLTPLLRELIEKLGNEKEKVEAEKYLGVLEKILSKEVIEVTQLLGFDFKRALGQPLTELISKLILKNSPSEDLQKLNLENIILSQKVALDEAASKRLLKLLGRNEEI